MNSPIMFIIALVLGIGVFSYLAYFLVTYLKKNRIKKGEECSLPKDIYKRLLILILSQGLLTIASSYGAAVWGAWNLSVGEHFEIIFGSYIFGTGFSLLFTAFVLYFYRPTLVEKERKFVRYSLFGSIPFVIIFFFLMMDAIGAHLIYPLPNALAIPEGLINYKQSGSFKIPFYGVVIVFGASLSYFIGDHYFYKKYGKHGLLDTLFLTAFPAGIIGARLWYCLVLEPGVYLSNPAQIFHIWDGGLAIQGGAMMGIIVGISFMLIFRRYVDIRFAMDVCIPTILIAQAIGRWGNFFNCEVHGLAVDMASWQFLPRVILYQLQFSSSAPSLVGTNQIYVPLFLIESIINFGGYFIIRYATKPLWKYLPLGFQASLYLVWYGLVRLILEPFRYGYTGTTESEAYGYSQSFVTAIVMISIGLLMIGGFYLWAYLEKKHKNLEHIKTFNLD